MRNSLNVKYIVSHSMGYVRFAGSLQMRVTKSTENKKNVLPGSLSGNMQNALYMQQATFTPCAADRIRIASIVSSSVPDWT